MTAAGDRKTFPVVLVMAAVFMSAAILAADYLNQFIQVVNAIKEFWFTIVKLPLNGVKK